MLLFFGATYHLTAAYDHVAAVADVGGVESLVFAIEEDDASGATTWKKINDIINRPTYYCNNIVTI